MRHGMIAVAWPLIGTKQITSRGARRDRREKNRLAKISASSAFSARDLLAYALPKDMNPDNTLFGNFVQWLEVGNAERKEKRILRMSQGRS